MFSWADSGDVNEGDCDSLDSRESCGANGRRGNLLSLKYLPLPFAAERVSAWENATTTNGRYSTSSPCVNCSCASASNRTIRCS